MQLTCRRTILFEPTFLLSLLSFQSNLRLSFFAILSTADVVLTIHSQIHLSSAERNDSPSLTTEYFTAEEELEGKEQTESSRNGRDDGQSVSTAPLPHWRFRTSQSM
jgi:hypothetical protein